MVRIKLIKPYKAYPTGQVINLSRNEAFGLIDSGKAIYSKDMTPVDYPKKVKHA